MLFSPGLVFYGGVVGGAAAMWLYCWRYAISFALAADCGAPGLLLGHAIGRVGCLLAGCCYGRSAPPDLAFAVPLHGARPYPTQLYEAAGLLLLMVVLVTLSARLARFPGALASLYVAGYAGLRLIVERYRGDDVERGFVIAGRVSTSQAIAVIALAG